MKHSPLSSGERRTFKILAVLTSPIWVPYVLVKKAVHGVKHVIYKVKSK